MTLTVLILAGVVLAILCCLLLFGLVGLTLLSLSLLAWRRHRRRPPQGTALAFCSEPPMLPAFPSLPVSSPPTSPEPAPLPRPAIVELTHTGLWP